MILETLGFGDENDYEYEILLKVLFSYSQTFKLTEASFYHFSLKKLALLSLMKQVTPSPDRKMIKLLTLIFLINCFRHFDILAKTRSRVTTASTFSCQNGPGLRASIT